MNPDLTDTRQQQLENMKQVKGFEAEDPNDGSGGDDSENEKPARRSGRRKIKIEYIEDKNRRHITFSKRKAGIMKKAYELSTLTGTQVLLLVVSETGLVYTFTVKLQPIVTKPEGKNLIQACLNAPDPMSAEQSGDASYSASPRVEDKKPAYEDKKVETLPPPQPPQQQQQQQPQQPPQQSNAPYNGGGGYQQGYSQQQQQPGGGNAGQGGYPGYSMAAPGQAPSGGAYGQSPQQQPQQGAYGQIPQPAFYGNQQQQQQHYMPHQQQQQQQPPPPQNYWQGGQPGNGPPSLPRQDQSPIIDDKSRRGLKK